MRVAVPLFGRDIAPRFGFASQYMLAMIVGTRVTSIEVINVTGSGWTERLGQLKSLKVNVLLAGGFPRRFVPYAESLGIRVIAGLIGDAVKNIDAFARGEEMPAFFCEGSRWMNGGMKNGLTKCIK